MCTIIVGFFVDEYSGMVVKQRQSLMFFLGGKYSYVRAGNILEVKCQPSAFLFS